MYTARPCKGLRVYTELGLWDVGIQWYRHYGIHAVHADYRSSTRRQQASVCVRPSAYNTCTYTYRLFSQSWLILVVVVLFAKQCKKKRCSCRPIALERTALAHCRLTSPGLGFCVFRCSCDESEKLTDAN